MDATSSATLTLAPAFRQLRITIMLAGADHDARAVADAVASRLRTRGLAASIVDHLDARGLASDAIVFGCRIGVVEQIHAMTRFLEDTRSSLGRTATAMFLVCPERLLDDRGPVAEITKFVSAVRWRPDLAAAFESHPHMKHHGAMVRWLLTRVRIRADLAVAATDVARFADAIAMGLTRATEGGLFQPREQD
jgi:menaquinone-dependent protoporphyrinogen IX oxidase